MGFLVLPERELNETNLRSQAGGRYPAKCTKLGSVHWQGKRCPHGNEASLIYSRSHSDCDSKQLASLTGE